MCEAGACVIFVRTPYLLDGVLSANFLKKGCSKELVKRNHHTWVEAVGVAADKKTKKIKRSAF